MAATQKKLSSKATDDAWDDIFNNLVIENEPPIEYIKRVIIITKDGSQYRVTAKQFGQLIEQEKLLSPDESEIMQCQMAINFPKLRADIEDYTTSLLRKMDGLKPKTARKKSTTGKATAKRKVKTVTVSKKRANRD